VDPDCAHHLIVDTTHARQSYEKFRLVIDGVAVVIREKALLDTKDFPS
jgi:hypothetical protein